MTASPTNGQPTGPADLREAWYRERLAAEAAEAAAALDQPARKPKARKPAAAKPAKGPAAQMALLTLLTLPEPAPIAIPKAPAKAKRLPKPIHPTREAWMLAAVDAMRPWFVEVGSKVGPVAISVGWPGGRGSKKGVRGQCWASHTTANKLPAIFVSPDQSDPFTIAGIILHEMDHAADDGHSGHKGEFAKVAKTLGFLPPWTSSEQKTPELTKRLKALLKVLGTFPHGAITDKTHGLTGQGPTAPPVQTTRMLKVQCTACGCIIRMTAKWIEDAGLPTCGCGGIMEQERPGDKALAALLGI
jgi:hypothetical protein